MYLGKGQLISKYPFGVFKSTKKNNDFLKISASKKWHLLENLEASEENPEKISLFFW